jgi:hypothetical protein
VLACGGWSFFSLHEYAYRVWPTLQAGHVYSPLSFPIVDIGQAVAVWIIASWVILWLGGAWQSSNDWRELWGRAVGFAWCAFWLLEWGTKRYFC